MRLLYRSPAYAWTEALPIGNGRLGAMIYGGIESEQLQLNEDTLWSGGPKEFNHPQAKDVLPEVRKLLLAGEYEAADELCKSMMGPYNQSYLPLGDLMIHFQHGNLSDSSNPYEVLEWPYNRQLDLQSGTVKVSYRVGQTEYTREYFSSYPDQVIAIHFEASRQGKISFTATFKSKLKYKTNQDEDTLSMEGLCPEHVDPSYYDTAEPIRYGDWDSSEAMRFNTRLSAQIDGGRKWIDRDGLHVEAANNCTLYLSAATSFNGFKRKPSKKEGKDPAHLASVMLAEARKFSFPVLRSRHITNYQRLFNRVSFQLESNMDTDHLPTDQRIREFGVKDPKLVELLFHYGRYLLISSSRPGSQPANLQGIWNHEVRPPWSSNWTLNINTEMNYWAAETCNLSECHEPLLELIRELSVTGRTTARIHYGSRGWVAHHNTDIWRQASPVGDYGRDGLPVWAIWPMGGVWLTQHLAEHYRFTLDIDYLRDFAYPIMKEAALFCLDWLVDKGDGTLVTAPSTSPEHRFVTPQGKAVGVGIASTSDIQLIWELFTNCIEAAKLLDVDEALTQAWVEARDRLQPMQIGKHGQLQEWSEDFEEEDTQHRHVSHLFAVYPGRQLGPSQPELFHAARRTLERRGNSGTGWSLAWKIGLWAHFFDGQQALELIGQLLNLVDERELMNYQQGGVYANLFDAHPPFQIDGNFGFTAGLVEMLMQSHAEGIHLLPALPNDWNSGIIAGLKACNGFEVSIKWKDGRLHKVEILSLAGCPCTVIYHEALQVTADDGTVIIESGQAANQVSFDTKTGQRYIVTMA